jgi:hypothetical protein
MLDQVIRWIEIAGTVMDAVLLLRVLALRLYRVYTFVTLYCVINVLIDLSAWMTGWESPASFRIFLYSRFVMAIVFPLAAWDVFEGPKSPLTVIRKLHSRRLISALVMTPVFALILSMGLGEQDVDGVASNLSIFLAFFVWFACALASLLFLLNVYRTARKEHFALTGNTLIWAVFFIISFGRELVDCFVLIAESWLGKTAINVITIVLACLDLALSIWCVVRLRGLNPAAPAHENAGA